jgi:hypothetical protein
MIDGILLADHPMRGPERRGFGCVGPDFGG